MSWDADLYAEKRVTHCGNCGHELADPREEREWIADFNYTHNTNGMIAAAYETVSGEATAQCDGPLGPAIGAAWWRRLDGASGEDGRAYLADIIKGLEADPARFRAMNPENGWGDYDRLLVVLREMRDCVPDGEPTRWTASG